MKTILQLSVAALLLASSSAYARDTHHTFPLQDVLETESAKAKLNGIAFYFGNQAHPAVEKNFGEVSTNKKTNALNKSDKEACEWVLLSALIALKERAEREGGNAVIDIKSNYKNDEFSSDKEYTCGAGAVMAGVALKGKVVKLSK